MALKFSFLQSGGTSHPTPSTRPPSYPTSSISRLQYPSISSGVLPKTSSGKLQRTKTRELYEEGTLSTRRSQREADRVDQVKEIAKSQLGYLKLAVFGGKKN